MPRIGSFGPPIRIKYKLELDHVIRVAVKKHVFGETKFTYNLGQNCWDSDTISPPFWHTPTYSPPFPLPFPLSQCCWVLSYVLQYISDQDKATLSLGGGERADFNLNVWISGWSTKKDTLSQQVFSEIVACFTLLFCKWHQQEKCTKCKTALAGKLHFRTLLL